MSKKDDVQAKYDHIIAFLDKHGIKMFPLWSEPRWVFDRLAHDTLVFEMRGTVTMPAWLLDDVVAAIALKRRLARDFPEKAA